MHVIKAGRTLEDVDHYFRGQPSALVFRDKVATTSSRPAEFIEKENSEVRRRSSVTPHAMQLAQAHRRYSTVPPDSDPENGVAEKYEHDEDKDQHA